MPLFSHPGLSPAPGSWLCIWTPELSTWGAGPAETLTLPLPQVPEHELLLARLMLTLGAPGSGHSLILMGLGVRRGQLRGRLTERQEPPHLSPHPHFVGTDSASWGRSCSDG